MPSYQKLLKGALSQIAKKQEEMDALATPTKRELELMAAAESRFDDAAPEVMQWYHGSPHEFDEFDFSGNLLKGEGALGYGPGGYLTGSEGLARSYADKLTKNKGMGMGGHAKMVEALKKDPVATAQYLRAVSLQKLMQKQPRLFEGTPLRERLLRVRSVPDTESWGPRIAGYRAMEREVQPRDLTAYMEQLQQVMPLEKVPPRIGRGGLAPEDVVRLGSEMSKAVAAQPRINTSRSKLLHEFQTYPGAQQMIREGQPANTAFDPVRRNVDNMTDFLGGARDKPLRYSASMQRRFDINNPASYNAARRNLYETQVGLKPSEMLPYDYPIKVAGPKIAGALSRLAEHLNSALPEARRKELEWWAQQSGIDDAAKRKALRQREFPILDADTRGRDVIDWLRRSNLSNREQMELLRRMGIPAMYFERAGHRGQMLPEKFDPTNYNFVVFDEDVLGVPKRTQYADGGRVAM